LKSAQRSSEKIRREHANDLGLLKGPLARLYHLQGRGRHNDGVAGAEAVGSGWHPRSAAGEKTDAGDLPRREDTGEADGTLEVLQVKKTDAGALPRREDTGTST
jgi:hypothetical protein